MNHKNAGWSLVAVATLSVGVFACSTATTIDGTGGAATTTTGQGGATSSASSSGSGGEASGCAQDCSTIDTPQCLTAVCNEETGQCAVVDGPAGSPCDDGLFCTVGEACSSGLCGGGATNTCDLDYDPCGAIVCDEAAQTCSTTPVANGAPCAIDDLCTVNANCQNGQCVGAPKDCFFAPVPDACHVGVCNPATGDCDPMPGNDGLTCPNDGDLCMVDKVCSAGTCVGGTPKDCSAFTNGCNNGACNPVDGVCFSEAIPPGGVCVEATNECNTGICDNNGMCAPVPTPGVACASATDACNLGSCDAAGACAPTPANEAGACSDGNACTMGETCQSGTCAGGVVGNYEVYFSETFVSNAAGWTLGADWQIGSATASTGSHSGNQDPAEDHTVSADNGIAGVVIGGFAPKVDHASYYLESPVFDTSVAPGPVYLELWRWLNSDYTRYMSNSIDVFDGTAWVNLWTSGGPPAIFDAQWTKVSHEITAYKNASMRVRFGFLIGNSLGVFTVGSWSVDDVVIANAVCN
jgi:hypothetical protein